MAAYRYAFNGMEADDEVKGEGNSYTSYFRGYDPRLGRWYSQDPESIPFESPYNGFLNSPVSFNDPRGNKIKGLLSRIHAKRYEMHLKTRKAEIIKAINNEMALENPDNGRIKALVQLQAINQSNIDNLDKIAKSETIYRIKKGDSYDNNHNPHASNQDVDGDFGVDQTTNEGVIVFHPEGDMPSTLAYLVSNAAKFDKRKMSVNSSKNNRVAWSEGSYNGLLNDQGDYIDNFEAHRASSIDLNDPNLSSELEKMKQDVKNMVLNSRLIVHKETRELPRLLPGKSGEDGDKGSKAEMSGVPDWEGYFKSQGMLGYKSSIYKAGGEIQNPGIYERPNEIQNDIKLK